MSIPVTCPDVERKLTEIWTELLGESTIGVHDSFFQMGGNSFTAVRLLTQLKSSFGCDISLADLVRTPTIAGLATVIRGNADTEASVIVALNPKGRRPPLFCFHPVSGNVSRYFELAMALGDDQPVYAVQSIGLGDGRLAQDRVEEMAETYVEEIVRLSSEGPYRLLGYSMGGLIAYECARLLHERTGELPFVALVDTDVRRLKAIDPWKALARTVLKAAVDGAELRGLDREAAVLTLHRLCIRHGIFDADFPLERLGDIHDTVWANLAAMRSYEPSPYDGELALFCCGRASDLGWSRHARSITPHVIEGNHYVAMDQEGSAQIARVLSPLLSEEG